MPVVVFGAIIAVMVLLREDSPPPKASEEVVVVLPASDGRTGSVLVQRGERRQVLDQPYAGSRIRGAGDPEAARYSESEVRQSFGAALTALPARAATFLLYFVTGTDELTDESKEQLQKILAELRQRPVPDVLVIGHTDTVGAADANDRLSLQRAERMKGFLVGIGIPADRIQTAGRGKRELLVPTADNTAEPRNRRV
ncbi:MAG: OmpA family protein, partial [Burkholderiales bacterium]